MAINEIQTNAALTLRVQNGSPLEDRQILNECPYTACAGKSLEEKNKRLREALKSAAKKHNLLRFLARDSHCQCDPETGMTPCIMHAAVDILSDIEQALKGERT